MKKRICFITKFVKGVHSYTGGMETHIFDLINELKKDKSYDISIVTSRHPKGIEFENKKGVHIYYCNEIIGRNPISRYKFFKSIVRKLKEINYRDLFDLLHVQSDFGVGYFQYTKKKLPIISTAHGTTLNEFKGSIKAKPFLFPIWLCCLPFYKKSERNMIKNSDKIICVSDVVRGSLLNQYSLLQKNKTKTIMNGVDLSFFKKINNLETKKLRKCFADKDEFLILSVGNIIKQKGYHLLIDSMPEILEKNPKVKLLIVGDGEYLSLLKEKVKEKNLENNVFFTGRILREDLVKYYSISNCFAFSTLRGEGLPYVLIEAMACENVVITTSNGGTDLVNNKNGVILKDNSPKEISKGILRLINDPKYYNLLLKESIKDIKTNCDIRKMVKENKKIYEEMIG